MTLNDMSDVEKKALSEMNRILNERLNDVLMPRARTYGQGDTFEVLGGFNDPEGDEVFWQLKPGRHPYNYYEGNDKSRYCFTPWKDSKGWYWAFNFQAVKNKATGRIVNYRLEKQVRFRKRKLAKARAEKRVLASY